MGQNPITIRFEATPNPATLKFLFPLQVTEEGFDIPTAQDSERSPLASKIFGFPWTSSIYIGPDFMTVTKQDWVDWSVLAEPLSGLIKDHFEKGEPVVLDLSESTNDDSANDSPIVKEIKRIIQKEIRPVVALDGGDIVFNRYENHIVYLHMQGSCAGCPSSQATLKDGIEVRMKELLPEIQEVRAI